MSKHSGQLEQGIAATDGRHEPRRLRKYDRGTRAQAVALAREVGEYEAARRMGISPGTLWGWMHRGQDTSQGVRATAASVPATQRGPASAAGLSNPGSSQPEKESAAGGVGKAKQLSKGTVGERKVAVAYTPSQRVQALEYAQQHGVTKAAADLGMSRFSIQEWRRKIKRSAVVKTVRNPLVESGEPTGDEKEGRVRTEWEKHKGLGPSQIRNQMKRTHHALGGLLVPADRYFGRAERVLAALQAGQSVETLGEPAPLCARALDLLRVTSHDGQVEVHLMGQRLWPPVAPAGHEPVGTGGVLRDRGKPSGK